MECGECEMHWMAGHASGCSRRCQARNTDGVQCDRAALHVGKEHALYDDAREIWDWEWPLEEELPVAAPPQVVRQTLTGMLQIRVDGAKGTSRLVNLGRVSIPYEVEVSAVLAQNEIVPERERNEKE